MSDSVFVDTNVLIYSRDVAQATKQPIAQAWMTFLWQSKKGRLSYQVLQEYYVNVTQKLRPGCPVARARQDVRNFQYWNPVRHDLALIESAWALADRYGFSWWDAQIVAAARRADCAMLLTEDLQHDLEVDGMRIVNPFLPGVDLPI
jgi:predicted nucleic acid-binding protein